MASDTDSANDVAVANSTDENDARGALASSILGLSLGQPTVSRPSSITDSVLSTSSVGSNRQQLLSRLSDRRQSEKFRRFASDVQKIDLKSPYDSLRRGHCLLINEKEFDERATGQRRRDGTDVDADYAELLFSALGFNVSRFNDLNVSGLRRVVNSYAKMNHSANDLFVMVILSHGVEGRVFASDGDVSIDAELIDPFRGSNCPSLVGKPKLFFIQACRGSKFDHGVDVPDGRSRIPHEADIMYFSSTTPGYYSWRNNQDGSWFIQSLCYVLQTHVIDYDASSGAPPKTLDDLMTLVKQIVAEKFESCTDAEWSSHMKQMPVVVSTLRKALYLYPLPSK